MKAVRVFSFRVVARDNWCANLPVLWQVQSHDCHSATLGFSILSRTCSKGLYIYICNIYPSLQSDLRLLFALLYCFWHTIPVHLTTPQTPTPSLTFRQQKAAKAKAKAAAQAATAQQAAAAKAKPKPKPKAQVGDLDKQGGGHRSPFTHHESRWKSDPHRSPKSLLFWAAQAVPNWLKAHVASFPVEGVFCWVQTN